MTSRSSLGLVIAMAVAAGCGGGSPSPTSAPTAARAALPAGAHHSTAFRPPVTVTLPGGWLVADDAADYFALEPVSSDAVGIHVFRSPRAASQDVACPTTVTPDVGLTAKDLVDWIQANPGFNVGAPISATVGNLSGYQIDVAIVAGWSPSCPFANGTPTVPLFVNATDPSFRWVVAGTERLRLDILDLPGNGTVVVDIDAFDGSLMDALLANATPIVSGMSFGLA